jgi:L-lysine 2,3-aminomutase
LEEFKQFSECQKVPANILEEIETASKIFPFITTRYVLGDLIDWSNIENDPIFRINFPRQEMVPVNEYYFIKLLAKNNHDEKESDTIIQQISRSILPKEIFTPSKYVPVFENKLINGFLHVYKNILMVMPRMAKQCLANCTYCMVWPIHNLKKYEFGYDEPELVSKYLYEKPEVTDIFFTGGEMLNMSTALVEKFVTPVLEIDTLNNIRIGTRALSWWPYRFTEDSDADELLDFFEKIVNSRKHLTIIAHITHPKELNTAAVELAIKRIQNTGAVIRCQCPLIKGVNDTVDDWVALLKREVQLGLIPYYMLTDANPDNPNCFKVTFDYALHIYNNVMKEVTGLAKTLRGPVVTHNYCKIEITGIQEINGNKYFVLKCLQSPDESKKGMIATIPFDPEMVSLDGIDLPFYETILSPVHNGN